MLRQNDSNEIISFFFIFSETLHAKSNELNESFSLWNYNQILFISSNFIAENKLSIYNEI